MDDNRILTNKIFKQKINELVGADVIELEAANDDLALNCKVFETGMDAVKELISGGSSELYYKANVVVDLDTGDFTVAPIGDSFTYDIIHDAVTNETPVRVIVEIKDSDGGSTVDNLLELHYTSEDLTGSTNSITFEKSYVDLVSNMIRFNRLWCTKSGDDTVWTFDQTSILISPV